METTGYVLMKHYRLVKTVGKLGRKGINLAFKLNKFINRNTLGEEGTAD